MEQSPGNQIDGRWTINQARGCIARIADRFDLTLECIRRHYEGAVRIRSLTRSIGTAASSIVYCERTIEFVTARNERIQRLGL